jgi:Fe-S-cluster containining protein
MNGIKFECTKCGECCINKSDSVNVHLFLSDLNNISKLVGCNKNDFVAEYCNVIHDHFNFYDCTIIVPRIELKKRRNGSCVFLENKLCRIYLKRPFLCEIGPFHSGYMYNYMDFNNFKTFCNGIGRGTLYKRMYVEKLLDNEQENEDKYENDIISNKTLLNILKNKSKKRRINMNFTYDDYINEGEKNIKKIFKNNLM